MLSNPVTPLLGKKQRQSAGALAARAAQDRNVQAILAHSGKLAGSLWSSLIAFGGSA